MAERLLCISCKKDIANDQGSVIFDCPGCHNYQVVRCKHCRQMVAPYECPECGFIGPN